MIKGIYSITNIQTNEKYFGESLDIEKRWKQHIEELNNGTHGNEKLQFSWNDYKAENFKFEVVTTLGEDFNNSSPVYQKCILLWFETQYILKFNSIELGYNMEKTFNKVLNGKKYFISSKEAEICNSVRNRYYDGLIVDEYGVIRKRGKRGFYESPLAKYINN